jgi:putative serine protease PepD
VSDEKTAPAEDAPHVEPTPASTVSAEPAPSGPAPESAPASTYTGSPFHSSRYQGIRDAIAQGEAEKKKANRKNTRVTVLALVGMVLAASALGGIGGTVFAVWSLTDQGLVTEGVSAPQTVTVNTANDATVITGVAAEAMPSIVTLDVSGSRAGGSGSGVVISPDGYIITNAHVVTVGGQEADPSIRVTTSDGRIWSSEVIGTDPVSDVAVIKIDTGFPLAPIAVGDSSALNVGDDTVAIGAPLGLSNTVTLGIVSALNRSITVGSSETDGEGPGQFDFDLPFGQPNSNTSVSLPVIQTDASINPGNSGGALLNAQGELIGINVAIASNTTNGQGAGSIGLGFAIPSNYAMRVANELISGGSASHGLLGATVTDSAYNPDAVVSGALIDSVSPGGAADAAGLRSGDVVTHFNGYPITNRIDLTAQVRTLPGGTETSLTYVRAGQSVTIKVTLDEL